MKLMTLSLGLLIAVSAHAGETQTTEQRPITNVGEFIVGHTVRVKAGLQLMTLKDDYLVEKQANLCSLSMSSPIRRGEASFDVDSDWKVKKTYSIGSNQVLILENTDGLTQRELKVNCSGSVLVEALKNVNIELLNATKPVQVLKIGREKTSGVMKKSWVAGGSL